MEELQAPTERNKIPTVLVLFIAELVGTAILLFFGCMGVNLSMIEAWVPPHLPGISFGLAVMISVNVFGHISGSHVNPQITIAALILGKIKPIYVPVYIAAQFIGAILGMGLLRLVTPNEFKSGLCVTKTHFRVTILQGLWVEIALTFAVVILLAAILDKRNADKMDSMPLRFGLAVACLAMVGGPYTGAALNTARAFAPSLVANDWDDHWASSFFL